MKVPVGMGLLFCILKLSTTHATQFSLEIKIPLSICFTSMPKKYLKQPEVSISNSLFMAYLRSTMRKSSLLVKIKSSTYRKTITSLPSLSLM